MCLSPESRGSLFKWVPFKSKIWPVMPNLVQRITLSNFQPNALVISFGVTCAADECLPLNNLEIFANIHFTFRCCQGKPLT